ncbi:hypothetical protein [Nonomuraea sp. LPB2021202275-12-8]|uniref:hypothetical protein n=1 Tax=Nonomuraea sp. LPB2021202275-12-8 TaxID=3120159 RepID=UPI00300D72B1
MALTRTDWQDLPAATRAAVEKHTGPIWSARTVSEGLNSSVAALLTTERETVFVKGLPLGYARRWTQDMEWMIGPYVAGVAPRVLWRVEDEEWDLLGYEYVSGRHAVYEPGSPDLGLLISTMRALGRIPCPDLPIKTAEERWLPYLAERLDVRWLAGDRLLHTDYNPLNVLISHGWALLIDWAWPTRGAGWIDPACLILRLIAGGHTAQQAQRVVYELPAWREAPEEGVDVFAAASVRLWEEIADRDSVSWTGRMAGAAREWDTYRRGAKP